MLTGHSLGGGLGKIVSAKLGIPIVAISAPGIYLRCVDVAPTSLGQQSREFHATLRPNVTNHLPLL